MIHLDFETFSELDVRTVGAFKYAEHPSTEVLIACYAADDAPVRSWSPYLTENPLPVALLRAIELGELVAAHNAQFEYAVWNGVGVRRHGWPRLRREQMRCTAARAAQASLPRKLEGSCEAMRTPFQKDSRGKALIKLFSLLQRPPRKGKPYRVMPADSPDAFAQFVAYCVTDVESERALDYVLPPLPEFEQRVYALDLLMNERGFQLDMPLVRKTIPVVNQLEGEAKARVRELTGGINPTQRDKLLGHLNEEGADLDNLQAETLRRFLRAMGDPILFTPQQEAMREVINLRLESSRASTKKLGGMMTVACADGRARGLLLYYGAHTGRWTGRLLQPHNFIRGLLKLPEQARVFSLLDLGDPEAFKLLYPDPLSVISQVMRGFIVARPGCRLLVVDYSAIEARILFWLAGEHEALARYRRGEDLYIWMASKLFKVAMELVTQEQRRIGKNLILGCGYGLGAEKFIEYCDKAGVFIDEEFSEFAVGTYRALHPSVKQYWRNINDAAVIAAKERSYVRLGRIRFDARDRTFFKIQLPSERCLFYPYPEVRIQTKRWKDKKTGEEKVYQTETLTYMTEYQGRFTREYTYGGKLVENIVQALARDIMSIGMLNAESAGYPMVLTVHDELVSEREKGRGSVDEFADLACRLPEWSEGCPIEAKGFECTRYRKD